MNAKQWTAVINEIDLGYELVAPCGPTGPGEVRQFGRDAFVATFDNDIRMVRQLNEFLNMHIVDAWKTDRGVMLFFRNGGK